MHTRYLLLIALFTIACSGPTTVEPLPFEDDEEENTDESPDETPQLYDFEAAAPWYECASQDFGEDTVVVEALQDLHHYFGDENHRVIEETVDFPQGDWSQVGMILELDCPAEGCDHWDRTGSIELLLNPGDANEEAVELLRHITPYRIGMCHYVDLTPLAGLLSGPQTLRSFIDTWVGPGHEQGAGWILNATFVFTPGPDKAPAEVINVWNRQNITVGQTEPDESIDAQIDPFSFTLPDNYSRVEAHLTTTGHSFGNTRNCAEFCPMRHDLLVNDETFSSNPWRDDCASNPVSPQAGTWQHNRNGWCPGAVAIGDRLDITAAVQPGPNTLDLDILLNNGSPYQNLAPADLLPYTILAMKLYVYE